MPTLRWLTRDDDIRAAGSVPYRLLEEVPDLGHGDRDTGNMLIQGDNLDALKALLPFYAGQVKCIYIDPPYNTRSAFEHYDDNLEHSQWLAMIWPRLELLRELLHETGTIWVSIDDREGHYLKVAMDEVFGRTNFVDTIIWRKTYSPKSSARHFSADHDYILVFAKNADGFVPNLTGGGPGASGPSLLDRGFATYGSDSGHQAAFGGRRGGGHWFGTQRRTGQVGGFESRERHRGG